MSTGRLVLRVSSAEASGSAWIAGFVPNGVERAPGGTRIVAPARNTTNTVVSWDNRDAPGSCGNTNQGLTHSSDFTREGLGMKPTRTLARVRKMNADPHPELAEAVMVSRFWRLVTTGADDECWPWTGYLSDDGYGVFVFHGRKYGAHELAFSFTYGEKRHPNLDTCHSCDTPACCNPTHLRFDTRQSNVDEMHARGRAAAAPSRKLTDEQIVEMRERRASGARQNDIAEHYGITNGHVSMIVRGIRWPHLGGPIQSNERHQP